MEVEMYIYEYRIGKKALVTVLAVSSSAARRRVEKYRDKHFYKKTEVAHVSTKKINGTEIIKVEGVI